MCGPRLGGVSARSFSVWLRHKVRYRCGPDPDPSSRHPYLGAFPLSCREHSTLPLYHRYCLPPQHIDGIYELRFRTVTASVCSPRFDPAPSSPESHATPVGWQLLSHLSCAISPGLSNIPGVSGELLALAFFRRRLLWLVRGVSVVRWMDATYLYLPQAPESHDTHLPLHTSSRSLPAARDVHTDSRVAYPCASPVPDAPSFGSP